jgi:hypothetical protein
MRDCGTCGQRYCICCRQCKGTRVRVVHTDASPQNGPCIPCGGSGVRKEFRNVGSVWEPTR